MNSNKHFYLSFSLFIFSILFLLTGNGIVFAHSDHSLPSSSSAEFVHGELIVGLRGKQDLRNIASVQGVQIKNTDQSGLETLRTVVVQVEAGQEADMAVKLRKREDTRFVEYNYIVHPALTPSDPLWPQQYGPSRINAEQAWDTTIGSSEVIIGIIDSGIDAGHPEFEGRVLAGYDFIEDDYLPQDECGHGTHVAGIAAAAGNNGEGIVGMNWNVKILPLRVLGGYCRGTTADLAEALVWAAEEGVDVVNLSVGIGAPSTLLENATYYAYQHGVALFAAAGNAGTSPLFYPAAYSWVMAIGATDQNDVRANFSNTGDGLGLMAPGVDILSTTPRGEFYYHEVLGTEQKYGYLGGTSMASPFVAGTAALMAGFPEFDTPDKIYQAMTETALDLGSPGYDQTTGYGLLQANDALQFSPTLTPTPTPIPLAMTYDVLASDTCPNLSNFGWEDIAIDAAALPVFGNNGSTKVDLPFTFSFAGNDYDEVTVSANGYLSFDGHGGEFENFLIPGIAQPNALIAPFWDNLNPSAGGLIYGMRKGEAPNRKYIVEWHQVPRAGYPGELTFEVILFEKDDKITFQYKSLVGKGSKGSSATIGLEYADGTDGVEYSYNQTQAISEKLALKFIPYTLGEAPPSDNCRLPQDNNANQFSTHVGPEGGFFELPPFCVSIAANSLDQKSLLEIQILSKNQKILPPSDWINLDKYVTVTISPAPEGNLNPAPILCYHYTENDLSRAGGHPENLFIATYDNTSGAWEAFTTHAYPNQDLIIANPPHFSQFGVFAYKPEALPVSGAPLSPEAIIGLSMVGVLLCGLVLFRIKKQNVAEDRVK